MVRMINGTLLSILKTLEKNVTTETTLMGTVVLLLVKSKIRGSAWMTLAMTCGATTAADPNAATVSSILPILILMASLGSLKSAILAHTTAMALSTRTLAAKHARSKAPLTKLIYICGNV